EGRARGGPCPRGWWVEGGSGTGNTTADLQQAFHDLVSLDLSREMLRLAAFRGPQIQSDASALPFRARSVTVIALINMFLFPTEVSRVLADDVLVLRVSTDVEHALIYLAPADVSPALPGTWYAIALKAGWGPWPTTRRAP